MLWSNKSSKKFEANREIRVNLCFHSFNKNVFNTHYEAGTFQESEAYQLTIINKTK